MRRPVGLNALFMEPSRVGGTETYVRQLVPALGDARPDQRFVLYVSREAGATDWDLPENVRLAVGPGRSVSRAQRVGWELTGLVARAARDGVALLHSLGTTSPLAAPFPLVVTVHDLIFEAYPQAFPGRRADVLRRILPPMLRRADRIVADSDATARDVAARYGIPAGKLRTVHLGPGRPPHLLADDEAARLRAEAGVAGRYVLSVATTQPHKNLGALVEAFTAVRAQDPTLRMVLVGAAGTAEPALRAAVAEAGLTEAVTLAGRVDDRALDAIYAGAEVFVYPSLYEGFGLPLLEAMQRGVPVLSSGATSLPEVGGDGVEYVDASDPGALGAALLRLARDPERRRALAAAGARRVEAFSWARAARETLAVHESVARA